MVDFCQSTRHIIFYNPRPSQASCEVVGESISSRSTVGFTKKESVGEPHRLNSVELTEFSQSFSPIFRNDPWGSLVGQDSLL
jgi:hypothetical protein